MNNYQVPKPKATSKGTSGMSTIGSIHNKTNNKETTKPSSIYVPYNKSVLDKHYDANSNNLASSIISKPTKAYEPYNKSMLDKHYGVNSNDFASVITKPSSSQSQVSNIRKETTPLEKQGWEHAQKNYIAGMLNRSSDNTYKTYMDSFKMANDTFDNNLYSDRNGLNNSFIAYNLAYNTDDKKLQSKAMKQLSDTISGGGSYLENNQYFKDLFEASNKYDYKNDRFTTNKSLANKFQPEILALQKELNSKGVKDRNGNALKEDGINGPNTLWAMDNSIEYPYYKNLINNTKYDYKDDIASKRDVSNETEYKPIVVKREFRPSDYSKISDNKYFDEMQDEEKMIYNSLDNYARKNNDETLMKAISHIKGENNLNEYDQKPININIISQSIIEDQNDKIKLAMSILGNKFPLGLGLPVISELLLLNDFIEKSDDSLPNTAMHVGGKIGTETTKNIFNATSMAISYPDLITNAFTASNAPGYVITVSENNGDNFINTEYFVTENGEISQENKEKIDIHQGSMVTYNGESPIIELTSQIRQSKQFYNRDDKFYSKQKGITYEN